MGVKKPGQTEMAKKMKLIIVIEKKHHVLLVEGLTVHG